MQNHEFEKQVQERMEQIKFTPSEAVWAEVEKNLKQRRKRRVVLAWFFLLCFLAGGTAWFTYTRSLDNKVQPDLVQDNNAGNKKENKKENKNTILPSEIGEINDKKASSPSNKNDVGNDAQDNNKSSAVPNTKMPDRPSSNQQLTQKNTFQPASLPNRQKNKTVKKSGSPSAKDEIEISVVSATLQHKDKKNLSTGTVDQANNNNITENNEPGKEVAARIPDSNEIAKIPQVDSTADVKKITTAPLEAQKDSVATAAIKKTPVSRKNKWQFGITAGGGITNMADISVGQKSFATAQSSNAFAFAPGPVPNVNSLYVYPSQLQPGPDFSIGVAARKKIKKRLSISVAMQYHYYSTSIKVGRKLDSLSSPLLSSQSNFYLAAGPRVVDHRNVYHFIELPVSLEWQVLKKKPLFLNTGFSLAQLLSSDALIYDQARGIYYADKSSINKTQLNLHAGIAWSFWDKKPVSLQVGPRFQYGASNLAKKSINGSNHLYSFGIDARILFRRK